MRKWNFFKWTRDNQKRFADEVAEELDNKMPLNGGVLTGPLELDLPPNENATEYMLTFKGQYKETSSPYIWRIGIRTISTILYLYHDKTSVVGFSPNIGIFPTTSNSKLTLGYDKQPWAKTFTKVISNGSEEIIVPSKAGTMALVSDIEDILRKYNLIPPETTEQTEQPKGE